MPGWANPLILRWARERLHLSHEEVVARASRLQKEAYETFGVEELRAWEAGSADPALAHLETLAEIYFCPVGYFFSGLPS